MIIKFIKAASLPWMYYFKALCMVIILVFICGCSIINKKDGYKSVKYESLEIKDSVNYSCSFSIYSFEKNKEKLNGKYEIITRIGKFKANFIEGKLNGLIYTYDKRNNLKGMTEYEDGYLNGTCIDYNYDSEKVETRISHFFYGNKEGEEKVYVNNKLISKCNFTNNIKSGEEYIFSETTSDTIDIITYRHNWLSSHDNYEIMNNPKYIEYKKKYEGTIYGFAEPIRNTTVEVNSKNYSLDYLFLNDASIINCSVLYAPYLLENKCMERNEGAYLISVSYHKYLAFFGPLGFEGHIELE